MEHARRIARAAVAPRADERMRPPSSCSSSRAGGHSWSYEDEDLSPARGRVPRPRRSTVRSAPRLPPTPRPRRDARRLPEAEAAPRRRPGRARRTLAEMVGRPRRPGEANRVTAERRHPLSTWERSADQADGAHFADRPLDPAILDRILDAGRGSSKNSQRWDFIVCRDRAHLPSSPPSVRTPGISPARPSRSRLSPRTRTAGRAAVDHVRPWPGCREHAAGGLGPRDRQRAGHGLRAGPRPAPARLPGRPLLRVPAVVRLSGRPRRATARPSRRPPAARRRWSTRSAGSASRGGHRPARVTAT